MDWRNRLKTEFKARRITLKEVGDRLNVTEGAVGHYLSARREPSIAQIKIMAELAGMSLDELVGKESRYLVVDDDEVEVIELLRRIKRENVTAAKLMLASLAEPADAPTPPDVSARKRP